MLYYFNQSVWRTRKIKSSSWQSTRQHVRLTSHRNPTEQACYKYSSLLLTMSHRGVNTFTMETFALVLFYSIILHANATLYCIQSTALLLVTHQPTDTDISANIGFAFIKTVSNEILCIIHSIGVLLWSFMWVKVVISQCEHTQVKVLHSKCDWSKSTDV